MIENSIWVYLKLIWVDLDLKWRSYGCFNFYKGILVISDINWSLNMFDFILKW
jgi:hypothetical protein